MAVLLKLVARYLYETEKGLQANIEAISGFGWQCMEGMESQSGF